jgi:hypothetical protein
MVVRLRPTAARLPVWLCIYDLAKRHPKPLLLVEILVERCSGAPDGVVRFIRSSTISDPNGYLNIDRSAKNACLQDGQVSMRCR